MGEREVNIGDVAPDFMLKDNRGKEVSLSQQRGKKVVLGFHPLAWTSVCAQQMKDLEANSERIKQAGAVAYGLSIDSTFCKKAWAESLGITKTQLLSDFWPHGAVASDYGVHRDTDGFSERAVFILDDAGRVQFKKVYPIKEVPDIEEIISKVESI
jgi:peroxiredoxin